jgi:predicted PurR-regulated permease PerM
MPTAPRVSRELVIFALLGAVLLILLWALRGVAILVAFAFLLAYVLDPAVSAVQRVPLPKGRHVSRRLAAFFVIAVLMTTLVWLAVIAAPVLAAQFAAFWERLPEMVDSVVAYARAQAAGTAWSLDLEHAIEAIRVQATESLPAVAGAALKFVGGVFSRVDQVLGLAVLPVLSYYLLADRERVRDSMLRFLPEGFRSELLAAGPAVHRALQSYVRGQALVCLTMGVATGAILAMVGVPNALLLGVLAGFAEILPLLGALLASVAIGLSGFSQGFWFGVVGLGVYVVNNWLLGTFITPRVMERYLEMHPFAVIVSVLAGAQLLGPAGAILALPVAAVAQAVIQDVGARRSEEENT